MTSSSGQNPGTEGATANDPYDTPNQDADRQQDTVLDEEGNPVAPDSPPEGLPWEVNPAVEMPMGNYQTLADAQQAQGGERGTTQGATGPASGTTPNELTDSPAGQRESVAPGAAPVETTPVTTPENATTAPGEPAPSDGTVHSVEPTETATETATDSKADQSSETEYEPE